ncbi:MAG: hypothetical protein ACOYT4_00890 [Nanoarchaeota archaeon]
MNLKKYLISLGIASYILAGTPKFKDTKNFSVNSAWAETQEGNKFQLKIILNFLSKETISNVAKFGDSLTYFQGNKKLEEIIIDPNGVNFKAKDYSEQYFKEMLQKGYNIICRPESSFMDIFYKESRSLEKLVEENVDYITFSPGLISLVDINFAGNSFYRNWTEIAGKSINQKRTIIIDSLSDHFKLVDIKDAGSYIKHEAEHQKDKIQDGTLKREERAYKKQRLYLWRLNNKYNSPRLKTMLDWTTKLIRTAEYLKQFGHDFQDVYPVEKINAIDMIYANIPRETLEKYVKSRKDLRDSRTTKNRELYFACANAIRILDNPERFAYALQTGSRYESIIRIEKIISEMRRENRELITDYFQNLPLF